MKKLRISLIVLALLAILLMTSGPASASSSVTIIEFQGTQSCWGPDMTPYMTFLPSGIIQVRDWPLTCTNAVYDVKTGLPVDPVNVTHTAYYSAMMKPDGTGQDWGDCPGSGWQAHFEGDMTATGSTGYIHAVGVPGGPYEGMMFQMHGMANESTGWEFVLTGQLIIPNNK